MLALLDAGYSVTVFDNLDNSFLECFERMKELAGPEKAAKMTFVKGDLRDAAAVDAALGAEKFDAVIHFAGRKAVGESVAEPMLYYTHNVAGTVNLIEAMRKHGVRNVSREWEKRGERGEFFSQFFLVSLLCLFFAHLVQQLSSSLFPKPAPPPPPKQKMVFSSSCTVYGEPERTPLDEAHPRRAMSPYGRTKLMIEDIFTDVAKAEDGWRVILLRYFNPVGAHPSGRIGEHPVGIPNNLMPYVQQVALGIRPHLGVFGTDYPTPDGTCVRDYIHVSDLADGHVAALKKLEKLPDRSCVAYNLGTGKGTSVLEMVAAFEKASGKKVPVELVGRRAGDTVAVWAATETAERELGWVAKRGIEEMCVDQWRWASMNPKGYE